MSVGFVRSVEGLHRTKSNPSQSEREFSSWRFWTGSSAFPSSIAAWWPLDLDWDIGSADFGLVSLRNDVSNFYYSL